MHYSTFFWAPTLFGPFLLFLTLTTFVSAQSDNCHSCILKAAPSLSSCSSLNPTQLATLEKVILGQKVFDSVELYKTTDGTGFNCLTQLMWDVVEYKGQLWRQCFDPTKACSWVEMMQWLEMIPRIAAVYGSPNPPAQVLKDGPA